LDSNVIDIPPLRFDAAKLTDPPAEVYQALVAHPMELPAPTESYVDRWRRLPQGRRLTKDGAIVLVNHKGQVLFVWPPDAEKPERCDHIQEQDLDLVAQNNFWSNCSVTRVGKVTLVHALDTLVAAWKRGDRATAAALEGWLARKHKTYASLLAEHLERLESRKRAKGKVEARTWAPSMT
jgi:hypothetical protein